MFWRILKPFSVAQVSTLLRHLWSRNSIFSILFDLRKIPKSSTYKEESVSLTHLTMLLILILNRVGDKRLPCGTPCSCSKVSDNVEPIRTLMDGWMFELFIDAQPQKGL